MGINRIKGDSLSIVAVSDIRLGQTIKRLIEAKSIFPECEAILLTSFQVPAEKDLTKVKIKPIGSLADYSHFIIYDLHRYVNTKHVLIIQWDGYIINPHLWSNSFLDYDYIGAPFIPRTFDSSYCRDGHGLFYSVGNGGFSLRSLSILQAPTKLCLLDDYAMTHNHEDGFFSVYHRQILEENGYKWPPAEIARNFCIESILQPSDLLLPSFGIHGRRANLIHSVISCLPGRASNAR